MNLIEVILAQLKQTVRMTAKVYSHIRFSDVRQAGGASIERQQAYAFRWAAGHKPTLDEELSMRDEGLSAFHQKHGKQGALGVFLKAIEDGQLSPVSVLVVEGLDRLSRAELTQAQAQLTSIIGQMGVEAVTVATRPNALSEAHQRGSRFKVRMGASTVTAGERARVGDSDFICMNPTGMAHGTAPSELSSR